MKVEEVCAFVKEQVGEYPLYISIDKDVLCRDDADTNWSQGDMRVSTMLECLRAVRERMEYTAQMRRPPQLAGILGVDICGECDATEQGNSALNDRANDVLLGFFTSADAGADTDGNKNRTTGGNE